MVIEQCVTHSFHVRTKANAELPWKFNFGNVVFALRRSASVGPDVGAAAAAAAAVPARLVKLRGE
eukprot:5020690-Amphidinium_carterae.1